MAKEIGRNKKYSSLVTESASVKTEIKTGQDMKDFLELANTRPKGIYSDIELLEQRA